MKVKTQTQYNNTNQSFDQSSDNQSYGNTIFVGTVEAENFIKTKEHINKINRVKEIRKQEAQMARDNLNRLKKTQEEKVVEEQLTEKMRLYLEKINEIKKIEQLKVQAQLEIGKAHKDAVFHQQTQESSEQHKKYLVEQEKRIANDRAEQALALVRKLEEEKNEEMRKFLEKRKQITCQERNIAHQKGEEFKEAMKNKKEEDKEILPYEFYDKNLNKKTYYLGRNHMQIDYSSSHLHNPLVVNHLNEDLSTNAIQAAELEIQKTLQKTQDTATLKENFRQKSVERAQNVLEKEKAKKVLEEFNREMEKLHKAQNEEKIKEGKINSNAPTNSQAKPASTQQKRKEVDIKAEKAFEDQFFEPKKKTMKECKDKENDETRADDDTRKPYKNMGSTLKSKASGGIGAGQSSKKLDAATTSNPPTFKSSKTNNEEDLKSSIPDSDKRSTSRTKSQQQQQSSNEPEDQGNKEDNLASPNTINSLAGKSLGSATEPKTESQYNDPQTTNRDNISIQDQKQSESPQAYASLYQPTISKESFKSSHQMSNPFSQSVNSASGSSYPVNPFDPLMQHSTMFTQPSAMSMQPSAMFQQSSIASSLPFPGYMPGASLPYPNPLMYSGYPPNPYEASNGLTNYLPRDVALTGGAGAAGERVPFENSIVGKKLKGNQMQVTGPGMNPTGASFTFQTEAAGDASGGIGGSTGDNANANNTNGPRGLMKHAPQVQDYPSRNNTGISKSSSEPIDIENLDIKSYIKEQEEYLRKLDLERKRLQEKSISGNNAEFGDEKGVKHNKEEVVKSSAGGAGGSGSTNGPNARKGKAIEPKLEKKSGDEGPKGQIVVNRPSSTSTNTRGMLDKKEDLDGDHDRDDNEEEEEEKNDYYKDYNDQIIDNSERLEELKRQANQLLEKFMNPNEKFGKDEDADEANKAKDLFENKKIKENTVKDVRKSEIKKNNYLTNTTKNNNKDNDSEDEKSNFPNNDNNIDINNTKHKNKYEMYKGNYDNDENLLSESSDSLSNDYEEYKNKKNNVVKPQNFLNPNIMISNKELLFKKKQESYNKASDLYNVIGDKDQDSPEKFDLRHHETESIASELDYSVSDRDRSAQKSTLEKSLDYNTITSTSKTTSKAPHITQANESGKTFMEFSFKNQTFTHTFGANNTEDKPSQETLSLIKHMKKDESINSRGLNTQGKAPSNSMNNSKGKEKKAWKMEFNLNEEEGEDEEGRREGQRRGEEEGDDDDDNDGIMKGDLNKRGGYDDDSDNDGQHEMIKSKGLSLAEMFKRNKRNIIEKYEQQQHKASKSSTEDGGHAREEEKPKRTKEEILRQRKEMMEYKGPISKSKQQQQGNMVSNGQDNKDIMQEGKNIQDQFGFKRGKSKEPNPELLDRLALGKKPKIEKKDMIALTQKNYDQLPEIKKKKEMEKKKEEFKKRQELVKKLDSKVRSTLIKNSLEK